MARDLRFLLALDHVAYDLERMGDHAATVAKQARKLAPLPPLDDWLGSAGAWAAPWPSRSATSCRPIVDVDEERARAVAKARRRHRRHVPRYLRGTLEAMRADPANVDPGARILFAAHYIERTGDRVTNIAEDVVFLATGDVEELN